MSKKRFLPLVHSGWWRIGIWTWLIDAFQNRYHPTLPSLVQWSRLFVLTRFPDGSHIAYNAIHWLGLQPLHLVSHRSRLRPQHSPRPPPLYLVCRPKYTFSSGYHTHTRSLITYMHEKLCIALTNQMWRHKTDRVCQYRLRTVKNRWSLLDRKTIRLCKKEVNWSFQMIITNVVKEVNPLCQWYELKLIT